MYKGPNLWPNIIHVSCVFWHETNSWISFRHAPKVTLANRRVWCIYRMKDVEETGAVWEWEILAEELDASRGEEHRDWWTQSEEIVRSEEQPGKQKGRMKVSKFSPYRLFGSRTTIFPAVGLLKPFPSANPFNKLILGHFWSNKVFLCWSFFLPNQLLRLGNSRNLGVRFFPFWTGEVAVPSNTKHKSGTGEPTPETIHFWRQITQEMWRTTPDLIPSQKETHC